MIQVIQDKNRTWATEVKKKNHKSLEFHVAMLNKA